MKAGQRFSSRVSAPIRNLAHRFTYIGLVAAAFALMLLGKADVLLVERFRAQVTDAFAPILDVVSKPVDSVNEIIKRAEELADIRKENAALRLDNERLLQWQGVARVLEGENKALRELLNFVPGPRASFISARVIADSGGAFAHSLLVNVGSRDGITNGQAVVTGDGLVGRVAGFGARATRILLITDLNSRIPVLVEATRTRAILAGNNTDRPHLIHLPPGVAVSPGDRIVTSGDGGVFPAGLQVGVIDSVGEAGISMQPFVRRDRIEYVRLINFGLKGVIPLPGKIKNEAPVR